MQCGQSHNHSLTTQYSLINFAPKVCDTLFIVHEGGKKINHKESKER